MHSLAIALCHMPANKYYGLFVHSRALGIMLFVLFSHKQKVHWPFVCCHGVLVLQDSSGMYHKSLFVGERVTTLSVFMVTTN